MASNYGYNGDTRPTQGRSPQRPSQQDPAVSQRMPQPGQYTQPAATDLYDNGYDLANSSYLNYLRAFDEQQQPEQQTPHTAIQQQRQTPQSRPSRSTGRPLPPQPQLPELNLFPSTGYQQQSTSQYPTNDMSSTSPYLGSSEQPVQMQQQQQQQQRQQLQSPRMESLPQGSTPSYMNASSSTIIEDLDRNQLYDNVNTMSTPGQSQRRPSLSYYPNAHDTSNVYGSPPALGTGTSYSMSGETLEQNSLPNITQVPSTTSLLTHSTINVDNGLDGDEFNHDNHPGAFNGSQVQKRTDFSSYAYSPNPSSYAQDSYSGGNFSGNGGYGTQPQYGDINYLSPNSSAVNNGQSFLSGSTLMGQQASFQPSVMPLDGSAPMAPPLRQRVGLSNNNYNNNYNNGINLSRTESTRDTNPYDVYKPGDIGGLRPRMKTVKKQVALQSGNFVVDQPISQMLLRRCKYTSGDEFTHMRYTAVTCDANDFPNSYTLRQRQFKRKTKIALVITMYNEDDILFAKSMYAVMKNIAYLCSPDCKYNWGVDGWQNFVVCIVSDGRSKVNPKTLTVLGMMGCYADGLAKSRVNDKDVQAHIFEYTSQVAIDSTLSPKVNNSNKKFVPVQVIFLLKEKNAKKINSHRWFFNAICKVLDPEVTFLLDVGTVPTRKSFYHLYRAFERDENTGGACGEIKADIGRFGKNLINPLVAAQNFEYKMSNILDKPLESIFGYISVLPGAFSAYRYRALFGRPLDQYFLGEKMHGGQAKIFEANMYLAEDRILCFELVTKKNDKWLLKYIKDAHAETDVPDRLPELISQRRRWLNGSFFASLHAVVNFRLIFRSSHTAWRKFVLMIEFIYISVNLLFNWFAIGNFYLAFYFLFDITTADSPLDPFYPSGDIVFQVLNQVYIYAIMCIFISSLGNRPQGSKLLYLTIVLGFAAIMGLMLFMGAWTVYESIKSVINHVHTRTEGTSWASALWDQLRHSSSFRDLVISTASTYGLYVVSSIMYFDPWHTITSMVQYMFVMPAYINVFMVYSFCNLHDVSWGTKGDNAPDLGQVNVKKTVDGKQIVEIDLPVMEEDLNIAYEAFQKQLARQREQLKSNYKEPTKVDAQQKQEDQFKEYRTRVILLWITMNVALIMVFTNDRIQKAIMPEGADGSNINPYLSFIFWFVAGLACIKFICSTVYLILYFKLKIREMVGKRGGGMREEDLTSLNKDRKEAGLSSAGNSRLPSPSRIKQERQQRQEKENDLQTQVHLQQIPMQMPLSSPYREPERFSPIVQHVTKQ